MWNDSGEFQSAARDLNIAHAPGYPLYMMAGAAFIRFFPAVKVAYAMNLLSAVFAALTILILCLTAIRITGSLLAAAGPAFLSLSPVFFSQSLKAEVYTLNLLIISLLLYAYLFLYPENLKRKVFIMAFLSGLAGAHHTVSLIFAAILFALLLPSTFKLRKDFTPMDILLALCLFALPLASYSYMTVRSSYIGEVFNWDKVSGARELINYISGSHFRSKIFASGITGALTAAARLAGLLAASFAFLPAALGAAGMLYSFRNSRRIFIALSLVFAADTLFCMLYGVSDIEVFFLPALLVFSLFTAFGLKWADENISRRRKTAFASLLLLFFVPGEIVFRATGIKPFSRDYYLPYDYASVSLSRMPENSSIISSWEEFTPLKQYYMENMKGKNINILSRGAGKTLDWPDIYSRLSKKGPVYFTRAAASLRGKLSLRQDHFLFTALENLPVPADGSYSGCTVYKAAPGYRAVIADMTEFKKRGFVRLLVVFDGKTGGEFYTALSSGDKTYYYLDHPPLFACTWEGKPAEERYLYIPAGADTGKMDVILGTVSEAGRVKGKNTVSVPCSFFLKNNNKGF